jgi:hypothetical protein
MFFNVLKLLFFKVSDSSDSCAQKPTFLRHSFLALSLQLLGFGSRARCRITPFFKVSDLSDSTAGNQRADTPRFFVLSLFCLCFFSALPRVSVSSLFLIR